MWKNLIPRVDDLIVVVPTQQPKPIMTAKQYSLGYGLPVCGTFQKMVPSETHKDLNRIRLMIKNSNRTKFHRDGEKDKNDSVSDGVLIFIFRQKCWATLCLPVAPHMLVCVCNIRATVARTNKVTPV